MTYVEELFVVVSLSVFCSCGAPSNDHLIPAAAPDGWETVAEETWQDYGANWPRPKITFNTGSVRPCYTVGTFTAVGGGCVIGETAYYKGLPYTEEVRVSVTNNERKWDWIIRHELLHALFIGNEAWDDVDGNHQRPEWAAFELLP